MNPHKRFFVMLSQAAAVGVLLAAAVLSGCTSDASIAEKSTSSPESNNSLVATIRSIDADLPERTETATLALG